MMSMPIALTVILAMHANPTDGENYDAQTVELAMNEGVELDFPQFQELAEEHIQVLLHGTKGEQFEVLLPPGAKQGQQHAGKKIKFNGVITQLEHHYRQYRKQGMSNAGMDEYLKKVMVEYDCPECSGARLKRSRRLVTVAAPGQVARGASGCVDALNGCAIDRPAFGPQDLSAR